MLKNIVFLLCITAISVDLISCCKERIAIATRHSLSVYDPVTGEQVLNKQMNEISGKIISMSYSPDGKTLLVGTQDKALFIFEAERTWDGNYNHNHRLTLRKAFNGESELRFSPDGKLLVSGAPLKNQSLVIRNSQSGQISKTLSLDEKNRAELKIKSNEILNRGDFAINKDGTIAAQVLEKKILVWDLEKAVFLRSIETTSPLLTQLTFSGVNKDLLATCASDGAILFWNTTTGASVNLRATAEQSPRHVDFSKGCSGISFFTSSTGESLIASSPNLAFMIINAAQELTVTTFYSQNLEKIAFNNKLGVVILGNMTYFTVLNINDIVNGKYKNPSDGLKKTLNEVTSFKHIEISTLGIVAFSDGYLLHRSMIPGLPEYKDGIQSIGKSSPNAGSAANSDPHNWNITSISLNPTGKDQIILTSYLKDTCQVWNLTTNQFFKLEKVGAPSIIKHSGSDQTFIVDDVLKGLIRVCKFEPARDNTYSSTCQTVTDRIPDALAIAIDPTLKIEKNDEFFKWDFVVGLKSNEFIRFDNSHQGVIFKNHNGPIRALAYNPNGTILASGSEDKFVLLWSSEFTAVDRLPAKFNDTITALKFSKDGNYLFIASRDSSIVVWDLVKKEYSYTFNGHTTGINSLEISFDGKLLISGSEGGKVIIWEIEKKSIVKSFDINEEIVDMAYFCFSNRLELLFLGITFLVYILLL